VAGFCFGNIMLLSFPEYLGLGGAEGALRNTFHTLSVLLSLPVMFYAARPFYKSAWQGIRRNYLNIDAPIVLAILITFVRSLADIASGHGGGYLDSLSGIVFFMLVGRVLQDRTYRRLSFDRDYSSYFPLAVSVLKDKEVVPTPLPQLKAGDTVLIHHQELIPADGILVRGKAMIDYSFVTGESVPVPKNPGEILYAGGRQTEANIEVLLIKEVAQSYLTSLWSRSNDKNKENTPDHYVHMLSRYFTYIVLGLALAAGIYWGYQDPSRIGPAVTGVLIIACPCALLLSSNFTHSNILRILAKNRFYLRDAMAIEAMSRIDHIVVDKTGTLTIPGDCEVSYQGRLLNSFQKRCVAAAAGQSVHPLSRALASHLGSPGNMTMASFREWPGMGIEAQFGAHLLRLGSQAFIKGAGAGLSTSGEVMVEWDAEPIGRYNLLSRYREHTTDLSTRLHARYTLSLLSGDNDSDKNRLREMMGGEITMRFSQQPADKLAYIKDLQHLGQRVMMIGDGLNDGPALRQSHAGIAIAEDCNNFTPASDGILEASGLYRLPDLLRLCRMSRRIVMGCFLFSIIYNLIGLFFAVRGELAPLTAAILMPSSTISILLISTGFSNLIARYLKL
jgi:Cu+-exporting ATPase